MKKLLFWTIGTILLMIAAPWGVLTVFDGMDAMGACFVVFFAINPLFSAVCGAFAGMNVKQLWVLPIIVAVSFLAGAWIFFEPGELAFLIYSGGYFVIGVVFMLIGFFVKSLQKD